MRVRRMGRQPKLVEVKKRRKEQERKMKWWKRMQPNLAVRVMRG